MSKLKLTAEHYQAAKEIEDLYLEHEDAQTFANYCDDRIEELEKPVPKKYRCIKNSFPFSAWEVGDIGYDLKSTYDVEYSEHPFHFEMIVEPVMPKPISMQEIHDTMLSICINRRYEVLSKLAVRIYTDHDLS